MAPTTAVRARTSHHPSHEFTLFFFCLISPDHSPEPGSAKPATT